MCGIFGIVRFQGEPIQENHFLNMGKVLSARPQIIWLHEKSILVGNQDAAEVFLVITDFN